MKIHTVDFLAIFSLNTVLIIARRRYIRLYIYDWPLYGYVFHRNSRCTDKNLFVLVEEN